MNRFLRANVFAGLTLAAAALAGCQTPPMEYEPLPKDLKAVPVSVTPTRPAPAAGWQPPAPAAPPVPAALAPGTLVPVANPPASR